MSLKLMGDLGETMPNKWTPGWMEEARPEEMQQVLMEIVFVPKKGGPKVKPLDAIPKGFDKESTGESTNL